MRKLAAMLREARRVPSPRRLASVGVALWMGFAQQSALAISAADVHGGWEVKVNGILHIYQFAVHGENLTGVTCGDCYDGRTLAFIDGIFNERGIDFIVTQVGDDGTVAQRERLSGTVEDGRLRLSGFDSAGAVSLSLERDLRTPNGGPPPGGFRLNAPYQQWAPWESLTPAKVAGVWLSPAGPNKQYFFIEPIAGGLRGMVCGPCDNPYNVFPLENFTILRDTLTFDIVHEQNFVPARPPFVNHATAHITHNEMQMKIVPSFTRAPVDLSKSFAFVLEGPLTIASQANDAH